MALWVVGHHLQFELGLLGYQALGWLFRPGFAGVDVFFVLSGYVITAVHRDLEPAGTRGFLLRRVFRIYPLHLFVLAIITGIWVRDLWLSGTLPTASKLGHLAIVALLLQPYLLHELGWNPVSWSIGVEMLCYALFPLALLLLRRIGARASLLLLLALMLWERHLVIDVIWGWTAVARGLAGFALGMMVQQMTVLWPRPGARLASGIQLGALLLLVAAVLLHKLGAVPLCGALLIFGLAAERGVGAWLLGGAVWFWLGEISFSLYLLHPTVITLASAFFPPARLPPSLGPAATGLLWAAGVLALLLLCATLTWRFIETPGRRLGARLATR